MIDMIVAVLILCFIVGIISLALFVASLHLYRESRRSATRADEAATASNAPVVAASVAGDTARKQQEQPDTPAKRASLQGWKSINDDSRTAAKRRSDLVGVFCQVICGSSAGNPSSEVASCSYACEVCGTCCASEKSRREGQGDQCQQLPPYPCGEFFVSGVDVGFKCLQGGAGFSDGGGGSGNGTFFFYRGRRPGRLLEPICPSDRYMTMAALPSVPYHLWFCPRQHPNRSPRCPDCRQVLSFELCDSEIQFQHRSGGAKRRVRGVWLVVCQEVAGKNSVLYRGDVGSLTSLNYAGKLIMYFGLMKAAGTVRRTRMAADGAAESGDDSTGDNSVLDDHYSAPGGLKSLHLRPLPESQQPQWVSYNNIGGNNDQCDSDCEADTITSDTDSQMIPSPLSMGSNRKAVKWPITQIESLMESSSSDEHQVDIGVPLPDLPSDVDLEKQNQAGCTCSTHGDNGKDAK